jgi:hypothetical protein
MALTRPLISPDATPYGDVRDMLENLLSVTGTAAEHTAANLTLGAGQWGVETDTGKAKVGNGTTAWIDLDYGAGADASGAALTGATFTGPVQFSGTTHAGLRLISLTTTQRDALTPATGMMIFNATLGQGEVYNGSAWVEVGIGSLSILAQRLGYTFTVVLPIDEEDEDPPPELAAGQLLETVAEIATGVWQVEPTVPDELDTDPHQFYPTDDTGEVVPIDVAASSFLGRKSTGNIGAMTGAEAGAILVAAGATAGRQALWVPAGSMEPRTTSGAESAALETTTNKVMRRVLNFDTASDEFAQFDLWLPKSYNAGTLTAQFVWSHPSTTTNFDVTWAIQGRCLNNDDASDQAFGTAVTVTDAGGTTDDVYFSPETGAVTLAGTPAKERLARFQVYRDVDGNGTAGNDDLAVDARLIGVVLYLTTNAATDD